MASSACSNSRKIRSRASGADADAGVAHQEADLAGADAGLHDQRDAAGRGELDGVAGEIEQHLPQPRRVADHFHRQPLVDIGRDLDALRLRPRRQQFGDILDQCRQRERAVLEVDFAGLDLGIIKQFLDQRQQGIAGCLHRPGVGHLLRRQRRIHQQPAHADDAVERRSNLVAGHRQEPRLGAARRVGLVAGLGQRAFALGAVGDVAADALHLRRFSGVVADEALAPGDPSRPGGAVDLLVMNARAVRFQCGIALFEHVEAEAAADQRAARLPRQFAIGVVDEGDGAVGVAQHDQVALRLEQAADALLGFLQFPVAVGKRLVV